MLFSFFVEKHELDGDGGTYSDFQMDIEYVKIQRVESEEASSSGTVDEFWVVLWESVNDEGQVHFVYLWGSYWFVLVRFAAFKGSQLKQRLFSSPVT